jgi:4-oxalocrotonate tautomerase
MPIINVKLTPGATPEQKAAIVREMTEVLVRVLDKNPASTHVVIEEVEPENWGIGGETVASLRARGATGVSQR